jgi:hypothetical protein
LENAFNKKKEILTFNHIVFHNLVDHVLAS